MLGDLALSPTILAVMPLDDAKSSMPVQTQDSSSYDVQLSGPIPAIPSTSEKQAQNQLEIGPTSITEPSPLGLDVTTVLRDLSNPKTSLPDLIETTNPPSFSPERMRIRLTSACFAYFLCGWGDGGQLLSCLAGISLPKPLPLVVTGTVLPCVFSSYHAQAADRGTDCFPDFKEEFHLTYMTSSLLFVGGAIGWVPDLASSDPSADRDPVFAQIFRCHLRGGTDHETQRAFLPCFHPTLSCSRFLGRFKSPACILADMSRSSSRLRHRIFTFASEGRHSPRR
jgi:hypothetical protein